jgi:hypothetical protein
MNAYLYTSSRAMHSEILNLLLPQVSLYGCCSQNVIARVLCVLANQWHCQA